MFDLINCSTKSKCDDNSDKLIIGEIKDETGSIFSDKFAWLKPKMHSFLVDNNEHKKAKGVNKNIIAIISHNEYKDVLLNTKCNRHSMIRIQRIRTYEISKVSLFTFDNKIYIQNNGYNGLALRYQS